MTTDTALTVEQLLAQVEEATAATAAVIKQCSESDWKTALSDEDGRSVGVVCHHIASVYPLVVNGALQMTRGEGAPTFSYDDIHALNHQHAEAQASVDPDAALALLDSNSAAAKEQLGALSDADLQVTAPLPLIGGQAISAQQMVQWFLVNHAHNHLESIHKALEGK